MVFGVVHCYDCVCLLGVAGVVGVCADYCVCGCVDSLV